MSRQLDQLMKKMEEGRIVCGVCVSLCDPAVSELVGMAGYDFVWLEGEHAAMGRYEMQNLMIGAHAGGAAAMIRLPYLDAALARPVLDMGPDIIAFPFINSAEDAKKAVSICRYPPRGERGWNPQRAGRYGQMGQAEFVEREEQEVKIMCIIEQEAGYKNLEEIVQVEGVDMVVLGPGDLSVELGYKGRPGAPEITGYVNHFVEVCNKYHMPYLCWPAMQADSLKEWADKGASMFCFPQDSFFLSKAIMQLWPEYEKALPEEKRTK